MVQERALMKKAHGCQSVHPAPVSFPCCGCAGETSPLYVKGTIDYCLISPVASLAIYYAHPAA